nr:MAG TPA: hypothetical protein [Caudoviricetes sp.]
MYWSFCICAKPVVKIEKFVPRSHTHPQTLAAQ